MKLDKQRLIKATIVAVQGTGFIAALLAGFFLLVCICMWVGAHTPPLVGWVLGVLTVFLVVVVCAYISQPWNK